MWAKLLGHGCTELKFQYGQVQMKLMEECLLRCLNVTELSMSLSDPKSASDVVKLVSAAPCAPRLKKLALNYGGHDFGLDDAELSALAGACPLLEAIDVGATLTHTQFGFFPNLTKAYFWPSNHTVD